MKRLLLLVSLAVLTGAAPAAGDRTARAQAGGAVVFTSTRDGDSDIYAVNPDGTGLTHLTQNDVDDSEPVPSPDGRLIMFNGRTVMNADGSGQRALRGCPGFGPGGWSPDSRHIVCGGYEEGLVIVDTADGSTTPLQDSGSAPAWSPDGSTIAFIDENRLFVVSAVGGARRRLGILKVAEDATPSWSPDSQRIAYISPGNGLDRYALWTIRADGSGGRRVVQKVAGESPRWSPNGSRILFVKLLHNVSAVNVVRPNGTGVHQVSISRVGEYVAEPAWSADGKLVLYNRGRFRAAEDSDIFAVSPAGHGGRALTHPFPAGGSNFEAQWLVGPRLSGREQIPHTIAVPFTRKLSFGRQIASVATDGTRAVPTLAFEKHPALLVWDAATGRSLRGPRPCRYSYGPGWLVLAGTRVAWTCSETGNTFSGVWLETSRLGGPRPKTVASSVSDVDGTGSQIGYLVGRGGTIAFSNRRVGANTRYDAWLLLSRRASKCPDSGLYGSRARCRPLPNAAGGFTTSVDAGRIVTVTDAGLVRILSTKGRTLHSWSLGEGIVTARLRGRALAVQRGTTLEAYDARTGTKTQTRQLLTDGGPTPYLLDVQGDLALYETGGAIHLLRLSNGQDKALRLPAAAPSLDAHLEPAGLFVSWNKMYDRRPGRLAFVPLRVIAARL